MEDLEDALTINLQSSVAMPSDLIPDILSRLPVKSIARCRCVSKLWASILSEPKFTEDFLSRSLAKRKLLIVCEKEGELVIFSCSQPQNLDKKKSGGPVAATYHMSIPFTNKFNKTTPDLNIISSNGLMCLRHDHRSKETKLVICNPSTGQSLSLPIVPVVKSSLPKTWKGSRVNIFFGYDPIEKQYKVLSRSWANSRGDTDTGVAEYQIITLGTGNLSWRTIECGLPHIYPQTGICINGVLYYKAYCRSSSHYSARILCFDLRSEKFISCIEPMGTSNGILDYGVVVNHNGKLGWFRSGQLEFVGASSKRIELWVLEDAEKQEWSEHTYILPTYISPFSGQRIGGCMPLWFVGVTPTKELVFSPSYFSLPFFVVYYNTEKNTMVRVEIQGGKEASTYYRVYTYLDHVENLKLMLTQPF